MLEEEFKNLEDSLDTLVGKISTLKEEKLKYQDNERFLHKDRALLIQKNDVARNKVEAMINRLKALDLEN